MAAKPAAAAAKPTTTGKLTAKAVAVPAKPAVAAKPLVAAKPVPAAQPVVAAKPVTATKPMTAAKPMMAAKPGAAPRMVRARLSNGKMVTYNCSLPGNQNKTACKA
ncbi:hypothetical protein [Sphingobium sp. Sx8-8]|uniref:hypothetical protein n=1 Tax=Sphingobium sp. Sx8-8 TaxID=2933617 RepID=UPI00247B1A45|nr:hypothetical protein [Sphingobium sp. Sx8-8]